MKLVIDRCSESERALASNVPNPNNGGEGPSLAPDAPDILPDVREREIGWACRVVGRTPEAGSGDCRQRWKTDPSSPVES